MTCSTSDVAASCSSASSRSRMSSCDFVSLPVAGTATPCGLRRIAALQRLGALRFYCFAACFVAPSHCLPRGSGQGIVAAQTSTLEEAAMPMSALGQKRTCAVQNAMSALPPKADMCSALGDVRFVPIADIAHTHSITSSARPISVLGMLRPSALAVLRFMISSTLVFCWTGRSAGLSPLRTRPV